MAYLEKVLAAEKLEGKTITYQGLKLLIHKIHISLYSSSHSACVYDANGNQFFLNLDYDYNKNEFKPIGDIELPYGEFVQSKEHKAK